MNALSGSNFLQALGWAVLNSLWQMALLWVLYQAITGLFRKTSPSRKSLLATSMLFTGFGWFLFTFGSIYYNETTNSAIVAAGFTAVEGNQQLTDWLRFTLPVASVLYLVLLIVPLFQYIRNYRYVQVIRKHGLSKADVQWRIFVRNVAAQMGIKKTVRVWISELVSSPVTIGYLKPVILVPVAAINHLSAQQAEAVLLHELAHIRRYDYFINLLIKFIQSVLYFNPFVKAFVRIVEREREKSCDEMVIQYQYDPHGYASALLVLEKANHLPKPLAVAAAGKKNDLLHRIEWIMGVNQKKVFSFHKLAGLLAGLLCVIALNAVVILSKPVAKNTQTDSSSSLANISSPFYFFSDGDEAEAPAALKTAAAENSAATEPSASMVEGSLAQQQEAIANEEERNAGTEALINEQANFISNNPLIKTVTHFEKIPELVLKSYQEDQVKKAIADAQKVLQEGQWREVEKNLAEVFTQQQKEDLRAEYMEEVSKLNLKKWEERLRTAYDKVNWDRVNLQLTTAVNNIRIDSLQHVYSKAINDLAKVQTELELNQLTAIPDTDITLESVEEKKQEVQKALDKIRGVKTRKIVRL